MVKLKVFNIDMELEKLLTRGVYTLGGFETYCSTWLPSLQKLRSYFLGLQHKFHLVTFLTNKAGQI